MLFRPKWVKLLPSHLRPDEKRVRELEKLRVEFSIPHEALEMRVMSSPATTRKVQRNCLENFRIQNPEASEKELLRMVLISRIQAGPGAYGYSEMTEQKIDQVMERIKSFDELCDYIIALDEQELATPDPFGIGKRIDEILAEEEIEKKVPAENLIKSLESTYFDLRKNYPDRDEHWFLANAWLKRYGSTREAKQKGSELTRFIAYKDTHQFSILDPPKSIRGLALFLVYKEFGEQLAIHYHSEFSQTMEPIMECRKKRIFLDKYKERNPRTWKESQVKTDSPYSLYWFFKGLEFNQEHPKVADKLWNMAQKRKDKKSDKC